MADTPSDMTRHRISWGITIGALVAASLHLLWPVIVMDAIALILLGVAILPWLAPLFKAVELPGGLKVEFTDLEKTQQRAQSIGLLAKRSREELTEIGDPNLALADTRIALERQLRKLAKQHAISSKGISIEFVLQELQSQDILSQERSALLLELLPFLNTAVHGAQVDPRASQWAAEVGPRLVASLEFAEHIHIDKLLDRWQGRDGGAFQEVGYELSEALVKSPREFLSAMRGNQSAFSAWLDGLPEHTFTMYKSRDALEDDLYTAYYERLRTRMIGAVSAFHVDPDVGGIAMLTSQRLKEVEVRAIQ